MAYTTINKSTDYFNTKLYTGTGSSNAITGVGFQPDWVWIKNRDSGSLGHQAFDVIRGVTKRIFPNDSAIQETDANALTAFGSDGFTVGSNTGVNQSSNNIVAWNWRGGGSAVANTDGDINSSVSANTTAGFSIVKWTGDGSNSDQEVGTGLSEELKLVLLKPLTSGGTTTQWLVYFNGVTDAQNNCFLLNSNAAKTTNATGGTPNKGTTAGRLLLKAGSSSNQNQNYSGTEYIAYCFAEKTGYSYFGTYTANNSSDGPFLYTGFRPAFFMAKRNDGTGNWHMYDDKRIGYNNQNKRLAADSTGAEDQAAIDIVSNGIKIRTNNNSLNNHSGNMIYWAFASAPIVGTNNIPAVAR
tara:strand:+ start:88 stop:1152 length:1065 start_codon:yes stop_codon:yes gene_type:complete